MNKENESRDLFGGVHLRKEGTSKSSDEYDVLERILIHPMTIMSKLASTFQNQKS
jgi:hypothetical protein